MQIRYGDFFRADLHTAEVVFCFFTPESMERLKTKFVQELKPFALVISYSFPIPGWQPILRYKPTPRSLTAWYYRMETSWRG